MRTLFTLLLSFMLYTAQAQQTTKEYISMMLNFEAFTTKTDGNESAFNPDGDIIWHSEFVAEQKYELTFKLKTLGFLFGKKEIVKIGPEIKRVLIKAIHEDGMADEFINNKVSLKMDFDWFIINISHEDFKNNNNE